MLTPAQMEQVLERIDRRLTAIEQILPTLATKQDLPGFAREETLERFPTRQDLKRYATKTDFERFATKEDLKKFATREDLDSAMTRRDALLEAWRDETRVVAEHVLSLSSKHDELARAFERLIERLERKGVI